MHTDNTILLACGRAISLHAPDHGQISIEATAHSLALINRFTGHARRPYSVAEHSLLVADIIQRAGGGTLAQLAGLMHDAHEHLVGDVASPLKRAMRRVAAGRSFEARQLPHARTYSDFDRIEHAAEAATRTAFGLITISRVFEHEVGAADMIALATERRDLMPANPEAWECLEGVQPASLHDADLMAPWRTSRSWAQWRDAFVARYNVLDSSRCQAESDGGMNLKVQFAGRSA